MTTETMTLADYARTHNASRQAAAKWRERGYLVMRDGGVDVAASDAKMAGAGKGRFRTKAHGGRRTAGERGLIDRPGMGYVGGRATDSVVGPEPKPDPWSGWHRLGNPATLSEGVMEKIDAGATDDAIDLIDYHAWEEACTFAGWDRWPAAVALELAADLGGLDPKKVEAALRSHVRLRLASLDWTPADCADPRLTPR